MKDRKREEDREGVPGTHCQDGRAALRVRASGHYDPSRTIRIVRTAWPIARPSSLTMARST